MSTHTLTFDTLQYAKRLIAVGVPQQQAEVQAEALADILDDKLATKQDLLILGKQITELEERLTYKLTVRLGGMLVVATTTLAALITIFHH